MNFQELIKYLSDESNWKESPFQKTYFDKTKIQANIPLNLYWLLRMKETNNKGEHTGKNEYNIDDYISGLGKISIDEQYSNKTSISECDIIFCFENHINNEGAMGLYVKVTAWRDSHNEIFFHHKNWENAREVFPEQKEILVFEKIDDSQ